jgi:hypothetical protein
MKDSVSTGRAAMRVGAILFAAAVLAWPAFYNCYPLLYPDSISYIGDGSNVARALFQREFTDYYGFRSLIYSLGILPLHWHVTPWPIVAFNALLTSYVLWLLVRALFQGRVLLHFLAIVVVLSLFTGLGWLVGWIMPDLFGPLLYLSVFVLVFATATLSVSERVAMAVIGWWGIVSHATHLMLTLGLFPLLVVVLVLQGRSLRESLRVVRAVAVALFLAVMAQVALNAYLDQGVTLNGNRPPYLLARVVADGPGRWYLQKHCGKSSLASCVELNNASDDAEEFLWGEQGWVNASPEEQKDLRREELTVVLGALREYPREELRISAAHFWGQLLSYGVFSYDANTWIQESIEGSLPGQASKYQRSRQAQGKLDEEFFSSVQDWAVIVSLGVIGLWAAFGRRLWSRPLAGLSVIVAYVLLANAAVTGNISNVEDRYQARVIWLVPLLALVFLLTWLDGRFSKHAKAVSQEAPSGSG